MVDYSAFPTIPVLDHGFVRLIDVMGSDKAIVEAARVSYATGTKVTRKDRDLIRYLLRHKHTSPFEMAEVKFIIKAPIFVARQWIRTRTANVNEQSGRYSVMDTEFFTPDYEDIAYQSATNNQGRSEPLPLCRAIPIRQAIAYSSEQSFGAYNNMLVEDVARETARIVLPLNTYTSWVWKIDLHNLLHFLQLRADPHAQKEIRDYAEVIIGLLAPLFPATFEAWEDYVRQAVTFSRMEMELLAAVMRRFTSPSASLYALIDEHRGIDNLGAAYGMSKREIREFFGKVKVVVPD